jgi:hypothetical protein
LFPRRRRGEGGPGLSLLLAVSAVASATGCASLAEPPPTLSDAPPVVFGLAELEAVNQGLTRDLTAILQPGSPAFAVVVMLPFAHDPGLVGDLGDELDALASHQLFLLSDSVEAASPTRSVLRAYQAVVRSARCLPGAGQAAVGCRLLEGARQLLDGAPDRAPPFARADFPPWKLVTGAPQAWAGAQASWSATAFSVSGYRVTMETLFVTLHRPWLSEEFLLVGDWYLAGACQGAVSDGRRDNDGARRELLPQVPVGMLLARGFSLVAQESAQQAPLLAWSAPRLIAWVYRRLPLVPLHSDPWRTDCADHAAAGDAAALPP